MNKFYFFISLPWLLITISGCIRQDLSIQLNSDGSGKIILQHKIDRQRHLIETPIPDEPPPVPEFKHLSLQERIEYKKDGQWLISTYTFDKLGRALPELEYEIPMMPRFSVKDKSFILSLSRERGKNEGFSIEDEDYDALFYNLSVTFPAKPVSATGLVNENTVTWKFDGADIEKFKNMEIGALIASARIPASTIDADIKPRLLGEPIRETGLERVGLSGGVRYTEAPSDELLYFKAKIPISGNQHSKDNFNGNMLVNFPLDKQPPAPFFFKDLKVKSLIIDGQKVKADIIGDREGLFSGMDQWGQKLNTFPVQIQFFTENPWPQKIDILDTSLTVETPSEIIQQTVHIGNKTLPGMQTFADNKKIIFTTVELGSSNSAFPGASIELVSNIESGSILRVYLDSDHGLRYTMNVVKWKKNKINTIWEQAVKEAAQEVAGQENTVYIGSLSLDNIPVPPFNLVFEIIQEKEYVEKTFQLEKLRVSQKS